MMPLVHAHPVERGRPWPVLQTAPQLPLQPSSGPAWGGPALGPECPPQQAKVALP